MPNRFLLVVAICLLSVLSVAATDTDQRGLSVSEKNRDSRKRVALVIGNSSYRSSPLKNPANDAKAMAASLRRLGFDVEEKTNLSYLEMSKSIESFGKKMRSGGVGLFYFAGHGMQVNGANYLIPVDAQIDDENEVRFKAVDAGLILAKMEQAKSDVSIVVLDACRNNPFARSFRSSNRGLASMDAPSGSLIAYATGPGKTAADGSGSNGIYTEELIRTIETPGLSVEEAFKQTRKAVIGRTAGTQVPWESSSLVGNLHFKLPSQMTDLKTSETVSMPTNNQKNRFTSTPSDNRPAGVTSPGGFTDDYSGIVFAEVPGGCFTTNSKKTCVDSFYIGKYEVTQIQYQRVIGTNPSVVKDCENCPVNMVSWHDTQAFIGKLNRLTRKKFRLPTDVEWEYACHSGGKIEEYCGGDIIDDLAWHGGNSHFSVHPVGQKEPNGLGIYDMSGNVYELVQDWFGDYPSSSHNPQGPAYGTYRVARGGSFMLNKSGTMRAAERGNGIAPDRRGSNVGFRLAASAQ